jgi:hypothetical protein
VPELRLECEIKCLNARFGAWKNSEIDWIQFDLCLDKYSYESIMELIRANICKSLCFWYISFIEGIATNRPTSIMKRGGLSLERGSSTTLTPLNIPVDAKKLA